MKDLPVMGSEDRNTLGCNFALARVVGTVDDKLGLGARNLLEGCIGKFGCVKFVDSECN